MDDFRFSEDQDDIQDAIAAAIAAGPPRRTSEEQQAIDDLDVIKKYAVQNPGFNGKQIGILVRSLARDGAKRGDEYLRKVASLVRQIRQASSKKTSRLKPPAACAERSGGADLTSLTAPPANTPLVSNATKMSSLGALPPPPRPLAPARAAGTHTGPNRDVLTDADLARIVSQPFKGKVFFGPEPLKRFYQAVSIKGTCREITGASCGGARRLGVDGV
jgi:hypothetical protein